MKSKKISDSEQPGSHPAVFKPSWNPEAIERKNHESNRKMDITKMHVGQSLEYLGRDLNLSKICFQPRNSLYFGYLGPQIITVGATNKDS